MGNLQTRRIIETETKKTMQTLYDLDKTGLEQLVNRLRVHRTNSSLHTKCILTDPSLAEYCVFQCIQMQNTIRIKLPQSQQMRANYVSSFLEICKQDIKKWKQSTKQSKKQSTKQSENNHDEETNLFVFDDERFDRKTKIQKGLTIMGLSLEASNLDKKIITQAYRKRALQCHPDRKGGSNDKFELLTNAYVYLLSICSNQGNAGFSELKRNAEEYLQNQRKSGNKNTKMKPKGKFSLAEFNKLFDTYRLDQPEDHGYQDWIKETQYKDDSPQTSKHLKGGFTTTRFNDAFEKEGENYKEHQIQLYKTPQLLETSNHLAVQELGVDKIDNFTGKTENIQYTDYKEAHTNTRVIHSKHNRQILPKKAKHIDILKSEREHIVEYNEEEWAELEHERIDKLQREDKRQSVVEKTDIRTSKHYDSIHSRMLENIWR